MCTRVVYSGKNGMVATGRSMDWKTEMHSNLWVFPKGMERNGETGANSLQWTSKYGSVVTSAFEIASTDGMNEKGLVANLLWLPEAEYPIRDQSKPGLAMQKLTTIEPTEDMVEVAIAAVEAVFDWKAYLKEEFGWKPGEETNENS